MQTADKEIIENEIENVSAAITITEAVKAFKEKKDIDKVSVAEKYMDYDFVGNAGKKVKSLIINGIGKAKTFLGKSKEFINNDIYKTLVRAEERNKKIKENVEAVKETVKSSIEYVKEMPEKIDKELLEKQMAHARDKFEKRENRQTFKSKAEDLKNVIAYKVKTWRENKKEDFAIMLETTKAYARLLKDKAIESYEHMGIQTAIGVGTVKKIGRDVKEGFEKGIEKAKEIKDDVKFYAEYGAHNVAEMAGKVKDDAKFYAEYGALNAIEMAENAKDGVVNAAVAVSGAVVAAPGKTKEAIKKSAKKVAFKGTKGLRAVLNKAAEAARSSVEKLDEKLVQQEKELPNKEDEGR